MSGLWGDTPRETSHPSSGQDSGLAESLGSCHRRIPPPPSGLRSCLTAASRRSNPPIVCGDRAPVRSLQFSIGPAGHPTSGAILYQSWLVASLRLVAPESRRLRGVSPTQETEHAGRRRS